MRSATEMVGSRLRRFLLVAGCGLAFPPSAHGQVDIESLRLTGAETGIVGRGDMSLAVREGNVELKLVELGGRAEWVRGTSTTMLVGKADLAWKDGSRFSNQGLLHLRHTGRTHHRLQPELYAQIDYAKSRSLDFRRLVGVGPRVRLLAEDSRRMALGLSYMFEAESLNLPRDARHPEETRSHRLSTYVTGAYQSADRFVVSATAYVQPRLDALDDVRVLGDGSLTVGLGRGVAVRLNANVRYDREPPDTRDGLDFVYRTGFSVAF